MPPRKTPDEIGATKGQTHEKVLEQTLGRERALRDTTTDPEE